MSESTLDQPAEISWFRLHLALLKPRILLLLEVTALCGVLVHDLLHPPGGERPWLTTVRTLALVCVGGFLAAARAFVGALVMFLIRNITVIGSAPT